MLLYWAVGATIGIKFRYSRRLSEYQTFTPLHAAVFAITLACQTQLNTRNDTFGRTRNVLACLVFAVANGVFETVLFLAAYDLGRHSIAGTLRLPRSLAIFLGFLLWFIYSGFIHAFFWMPNALPNHIAEKAPPFVSHGLPLLTIISLAWILLYETTGDAVAICLCHGIVDLMFAWKTCLPCPTLAL